MESVADTAHQAVALRKQFFHALFYRLIAEKRRNEFTRTVRLVSARKAAGDKHDLTFFYLLCKRFHRTGNVVCRGIADHENIRLRACVLERLCGIVFAVGAGEYGDQYFGLRPFYRAGEFAFSAEGEVFYLLFGRLYVARINGFQLIFVKIGKFLQRKRFASEGDFFCLNGSAEQDAYLLRLCKFEHERTVRISKNIFRLHFIRIRKPDAVAHAHF